MKLGESTERLIDIALQEDIGPGDVTTDALIPPQLRTSAHFIAKEPLVVCGTDVVCEVFRRIDPALAVTFTVTDGKRVGSGERFGTIHGSCSAILKGERTALNFLQRLSGIATKTSRVVQLLSGLPTKVLDTRKTAPGWRELEKYAVKIGGGTNHRAGLYDAVLIKNNHIDALGGDLALALKKAEAARERGLSIEVEVRNEAELRAAVAGKPDIILLDNYTPDGLRAALALIAELKPEKTIRTEASGGITEDNVRTFAESGVDFVSLGSLTHGARAVDISLHFSHER